MGAVRMLKSGPSQLVIVLVGSFALAWWFLTGLGGWANPTLAQQIAREAFVLYTPTFVPTFALFEALGPMHKAWVMLVVLLAVTLQNVLIWLGVRWAARAIQKQSEQSGR
jgi:hypothetical protein